MLFPQDEPSRWAEKHKLEIVIVKCLKCKQKIETGIPIAIKNYRGLRTKEHGCPPKYHQYFLVPNTKEEEFKLRSAIK